MLLLVSTIMLVEEGADDGCTTCWVATELLVSWTPDTGHVDVQVLETAVLMRDGSEWPKEAVAVAAQRLRQRLFRLKPLVRCPQELVWQERNSVCLRVFVCVCV